MFIPEDIIEKVRENNDIVDVISEYVSLKRRGRNFVGLCPFHKEKTPSFSVQQEKQIYHCFGCGEGGNVFSFLMKYKNIGFVDAVSMLAERANIDIPNTNNYTDSKMIALKEKLYEVNRVAAKYFYLNLRESSTAQSYFKSRGIGPEIIKKFGLGYSISSWNGLLRYMRYKGYSQQQLEQAGLIIKKDDSKCYDRFRNRVMFPVFDVRGRVIGFGGRVLDDSKPKYLNSPETLIFNKGNNLYALNFVSKTNADRRIIIVEGYMDAIALHQYGIDNAVASLGTALTRDQARLIKRYCDEVIICYDSDAAGQAATLRGLDILSSAGLTVKIINIPKGKDPDEFIRSEGKEAFIRCIEDAMPLIDYKIMRNAEKFDINTTDGKIGFVKAASQVLADIDDPVVIDTYIKKLSTDTNISTAALYDEVKRLKGIRKGEQEAVDKHISGKSRYNNNIDGQKLYLEPAYVKAEKFILYILCENKEYFQYIKKKLPCEDFIDETYRKAACFIYDKLKNNEDVIPASVISIFDDPDDMKKVSQIFNIEKIVDRDNIKKIIDEHINLIYRYKLISKKDKILTQIKEYEAKGDVEQSAQLLMKVVEIEKQLRMI